MKILYDYFSAQPYRDVKVHGGGEYGIEVAKLVLQYTPLNVDWFFWINQDYPIASELLPLVKERSVNIVAGKHPFEIGRIIKKYDINQVFSPVPYYLSELGVQIAKKVKLKGTIHGLRYLEIPKDEKDWYFRRSFFSKGKGIVRYILPSLYTKREYKRVERLLKILNYSCLMQTLHTKYDLCVRFPSEILPDNIFVETIIPKRFFESKSLNEHLLSERFGLKPETYYLLVGGGRSEKNLLRVCEALEKADKFLPAEMKLVTTGIPPWLERLLFRKESFKKRGLCLPYVSGDDLELLYKHCYALLYPSLSEGLGYPPLQAMKYGKPVIASGISGIPIFYGGAPLYVNPFSVEELANRMLLLLDHSVYEEYSRKARSFFEMYKKEYLTKDFRSLLFYVFEH